MDVSVLQLPVRFGQGAGDGDGDSQDGVTGRIPFTIEGDDLPYRVEVWDTAGLGVERVIAITADASIGYAAFYAAARDNPGRDISLSHKGRELSRWSGKTH